MEVKVINKSNNELPKYETPLSAGMDLKADLSNLETVKGQNAFIKEGKIGIRPGGRALIPTGLFTAIPEGYEVQVRPRSGLAIKHGITVCNTPGTIDADYRNEWGVILINLGTETFIIDHGDRIAQMVLNKVERVEWKEVESLNETERKGGFGSTDKKSKKSEPKQVVKEEIYESGLDPITTISE